MQELLFSLKSVVVVILVCEMFKNLLITKQYTKYINYAVSVFVTGFIIMAFRGVAFTVDHSYDFNYTSSESGENMLKKQYEDTVCERVSKKLAEKGIEISEITAETDDKYNIENLKIKAPERAVEIEQILEGLGIVNYEVEVLS